MSHAIIHDPAYSGIFYTHTRDGVLSCLIGASNDPKTSNMLWSEKASKEKAAAIIIANKAEMDYLAECGANPLCNAIAYNIGRVSYDTLSELGLLHVRGRVCL